MLPRKKQIQSLLSLLSVALLATWLYINTPSVTSPSELFVIKPEVDTHAITRSHTYRNSSSLRAAAPNGETAPKKHNETLANLHNNMTLHKANKSEIQSIVKKVDAAVSDVAISNPHPFKYLIKADGICDVADLFLIVYVHTAPQHHKRRSVIRQTWGNFRQYLPGHQVRVVFVMGKSQSNSAQQAALEYEASLHRDIVQEDFHDSYHNLTYKGIAALKWISHHCQHAKFVLKTDDDIFVNMFTLLTHLTSVHEFGMNRTKIIFCLLWRNMMVMRKGKWKVSEAEWKGKYYPLYCSGSAFIMSTDVAVNIYHTSFYVPFFWVDDLYITGLVPRKMGKDKVSHVQFMSTYVLDGRKLRQKFTGASWWSYIFSHVHDLNSIQSVWRQVVRLAKGLDRPAIEFALPGHLPTPTPKPTPKPDPKKDPKKKEPAIKAPPPLKKDQKPPKKT